MSCPLFVKEETTITRHSSKTKYKSHYPIKCEHLDICLPQTHLNYLANMFRIIILKIVIVQKQCFQFSKTKTHPCMVKIIINDRAPMIPEFQQLQACSEPKYHKRTMIIDNCSIWINKFIAVWIVLCKVPYK